MIPTTKSPTLLKALSAGFAGGIAWIGAMLLFFGPAAGVYEYQVDEEIS